MNNDSASTHSCPILYTPSGGTPKVLTSNADIDSAGRELASGTGPLAVDTERASAYRYDDRAFLIQLRRAGSGTFLIDPESNRGATRALAPYLNPLTWIIHCAPSDLPCLAELDLYPAHLLDTEVAGRLLGLEKVNLAAMTETLLGVGLAKGHGKEDWSTRPLPTDWIDYAALDVELLVELAATLDTALAEVGRKAWFDQECEYIRESHLGLLDATGSDPQRWRSLKGIGKLKSPAQLAVARSLWLERDRVAQLQDVTPTRVLPHATIIGIAETLPRSVGAISSIKGFPRRRKGAPHRWLHVVQQALDAPQQSWPQAQKKTNSGRLHHRHWSERAPEIASLFDDISAAVLDFSDSTGIRQDSIVTSSELRNLSWWIAREYPRAHGAIDVSTSDNLPRFDELTSYLITENKRPWQAELVSELVSQKVFLPRRIV